MPSHSRAFPLLVAALLSSASVAQSPTVRLSQGDALPGGELVTTVVPVGIDDRGSWLALVDTDLADLTQDEALLRDGLVILREGASVEGPIDLVLDEFEALASVESGDLAAILLVRTPFSSSIDALYHNGRLVALRTDPVGAPEVPAGTTWERFHDLWLNDARTLLVHGDIANPVVAGPREGALVRYQLDDAGTVLARNVLLTKGQFVPALNGTVSLLGSSLSTFSFNGHGDFLGFVSVAGGPGFLLKNLDTVLAREGDPAPIPGRSYASLALSKVALNDSGEFAFTAMLDGTVGRFCLLKNGQKIAQSDEAQPFLPGPLANSFAAPLFLANSGDLFWFADDSSLQSGTLLRNQDVIVQQGVTRIGGQLVTRVYDTETSFRVSPDGRFWAARVRLETSLDVLVTVDFGLVEPLQGCVTNAAALRLASGAARVGQRLTLTLDGAQGMGAFPAVLFGTRRLRSSSGCGALLAAGELLIEPASRLATLFGTPWTGAAVSFDVDIPADPALVDLELFAQGVFIRPGTPRLRLSNGLRLQIGAP